MMNFISNFLGLFQESAPWLLLGLLIAGGMKWLLPIDLLKKHVGKSNFVSVLKAAFIGAPLPLCSCGVIPAAIGLRRVGASKSATVSFLVATPETGVDSISVSYALLGPFIAIMRPISAILSAIYVGALTLFFIEKGANKGLEPSIGGGIPVNEATGGCCAQSDADPQKKSGRINEEVVNDGSPNSAIGGIIDKLVKVLSFATGKLLEDITRWLLIGLILAAAIKTWVPADFLTQWGDGFVAMLVMALIGIPMYICATASTPIAAGFLAIGVSPGAVLVFMLAGPATNLSTMGMIRKEMGSSVLAAYLIGIMSASISLGYITNWAIKEFGFEVYQVAVSNHLMGESLLDTVSAVILMLLMLNNGIKLLFKNKQRNPS